MDVDIRPLPGHLQQSFCQISAADAFSSHEKSAILLLLVVAVGTLQPYDVIASLVDGSKQ